MYDFDMKQLLETFDGDAEKLANAFADSLNAELAHKKEASMLNDAADDVANAWEEFVDEYFNTHKLPKGMEESDFYIDGTAVTEILELLIKISPYLDFLYDYTNKINALGEELVDKAAKVSTATKNNATSSSGTTKNDFDSVMQSFFKKNHI